MTDWAFVWARVTGHNNEVSILTGWQLGGVPLYRLIEHCGFFIRAVG